MIIKVAIWPTVLCGIFILWHVQWLYLSSQNYTKYLFLYYHILTYPHQNKEFVLVLNQRYTELRLYLHDHLGFSNIAANQTAKWRFSSVTLKSFLNPVHTSLSPSHWSKLPYHYLASKTWSPNFVLEFQWNGSVPRHNFKPPIIW